MTSPPRGLLAPLLALSLAAGASTVVAARPTSALAEGRSPVLDAADASFAEDRRKFGLDTSHAAVAAGKAEGVGFELTGFPMTGQELARIRRQDKLIERLAQLDADLYLTPGYAGAWLDREAGDKITVASTEAGRGIKELVLASLPPGTALSERAATFTKAELVQQFESAILVSDELRAAGVPITGSRVSVPENRLIITIAVNASPSDESRLAAALPEAAIVREDGQPLALSRWDTGGHPTYGGSVIRNSRTYLGGGCTAGIGGSVRGKPYIMAAGHCGSETWYWGYNPTNSTYTAARPLGYANGNRYMAAKGTGATIVCDCMGITVPDDSLGFISSRVFTGGAENASQPAPYRYDHTARKAEPYVTNEYADGMRACHTGRKSGLKCGVITADWSTNSPSGDNITVRVTRTDAAVVGGDSGAPVGRDGAWLGLVHAGGTSDGKSANNMIFTRAHYVVEDMLFEPRFD